MPIRRQLSEKENQVFKNCWNPVRDTGIFIKHHLFIYKRSIIDQNFKGVAQKKGCHVLQKFKIEIGVAGANFEPHPPNFVKIHIF